MKYMVVVNQKFIVSVEAESALGAEDEMLRLGFVATALALTVEELNTDMLKWFFENGQTISYDELVRWDKEYSEALEARELAEEDMRFAYTNLESIKQELADAKEEAVIKEEDFERAEGIVHEMAEKLGLVK